MLNVIRLDPRLLDTAATGAVGAAQEGLVSALLRSMADSAVITTDQQGNVTSWSEGAQRMLGWPASAVIGLAARQVLCDGLPGSDVSYDPGTVPTAKPSVSEGWCLRQGDKPFWARSTVTPVIGPDHIVSGGLIILQDRTEERSAAELNRLEAELLRGILAATRDCIDVLHLDGALATQTDDVGRQPGCVLFENPAALGPDAEQAFATAREGGVGHFCAREEANETAAAWEVQVTPILSGDGFPVALLAVSRDMIQTRRAAEQSRLLVMEMSHRLKNALAVVQAIASQTLRGPTMPANLREAFNARLMTLFQAQDILTQTGWESADLHRLVDGVAALHSSAPSMRFRVAGPVVTVGPRLGLALAMVLHEMGTNATKYGALSSASGTVDLVWQVLPRTDGPWFILTWTEKGGPPVSAPAHNGFGTKLIRLSFPPEMGVVSELTFPESGVVLTLQGPMSALLSA